MKSRTCLLAALSAAMLHTAIADPEKTYDPLRMDEDQEVLTADFVVKDPKRDREIPVKCYFPHTTDPAPVVLFSHGLGGSKENNPYLGNHWARRGYLAVFMQHDGSDEAVWKNAKPSEAMRAMKKAASARNAKLRFEDVPALIDQLEVWNVENDHPLYQRMDLKHIGMSGHSFGAVTTQSVSGQQALMGLINYTDERIDAAVALSPSSPRGRKSERAFGKVKIPWMLMTGTKDVSPIGNSDLESRLGVFPALPQGDKYEVVLDEAEHSAFSERSLPGDKEKRNPNHHRVILALSTAFWDAYLKNDEEAKAWLQGEGPRSVMEENDRWQRK